MNSQVDTKKCPTPNCDGELFRVDDQYDRWWEECTGCNHSILLSKGSHRPENQEEDECDRCRGGGCPMCEPHRHITGIIYP